jgi:hypothetical protein
MMSLSAFAQDINPPEDTYETPKKEYSPFVDDDFPTWAFFGVELPAGTSMTVQERAYTSPIWYTP